MRAKQESIKASTTQLGSYKQLLQILVEHREHWDDSQKNLAIRLGRSQSYVSKVEAGRLKLDLVEFILWCRASAIDPMVPFAGLCAANDLPRVKIPRRRARTVPEAEWISPARPAKD